jgi:hypothetical protein
MDDNRPRLLVEIGIRTGSLRTGSLNSERLDCLGRSGTAGQFGIRRSKNRQGQSRLGQNREGQSWEGQS